MEKEQLQQLQDFVELCKHKPEVLHKQELTFFKSYLERSGILSYDPFISVAYLKKPTWSNIPAFLKESVSPLRSSQKFLPLPRT